MINTKIENNQINQFQVVPITVKYPVFLIERIDDYAVENNMSRSEFLRNIVIEYSNYRRQMRSPELEKKEQC